MFDNIEQGVEVYKNKVREYRTVCANHDRTKEVEQQLAGMEAALGLSDGDINDIRRVVEEDISTPAV